MKITCQSCQSKYTVSDDKVQGKTVKIKCKKCGATIVVNSSGATSRGQRRRRRSRLDIERRGRWVVPRERRRRRSADDGRARTSIAAYQSGVVNAETYVWADGMADWQPIAQVDALVAALERRRPRGVRVPRASVCTGLRSGSAYAPATRRRAFAGACSRQLIHLFESQRLAQTRSVAIRCGFRKTSSSAAGWRRRRRRTTSRTSAPLFSGRRSTHRTGQRDENSTLFSLSALTAKAAAVRAVGAAHDRDA